MQNPWNNLPTKSPYILAEDMSYIEVFNRQLKSEYAIHTELLPEPFLGSPDTANVILLNLNPGFDERDLYWHTKLDFIRECRKNLLHEANPPFYLLNPLFKESGGYTWWSSHLRECIQCVGQDAVARGVMNIEYFPYHSKKYKEFYSKNLPDGVLPSQQYMFFLVREAIKRRKLILIMRRELFWKEHVPELKSYPYLRLNSSQSAYISNRNVANGQFSQVIEALKK